MRIDRLDLIAFGSFTDRSLDLSAPGLHLIYGPNEAGKSTARAAISTLLFGFDLRTPYAFVHPMNRLQLGAAVRDDVGALLEVTRYKRNKDPLVDGATDQPIPPARWAGVLQGVTRSDFEAMFTLGWDDLLRGTADLLQRQGVVEETVFAAGLGIRELGSVLDSLESEANQLFAPRASTRAVNAALKAHEDARRAARELAVRPTHFADLEKRHRRAADHLRACRDRSRNLTMEQERLITVRGVLPALVERAQLLEERVSLLDQGPALATAWADRVESSLAARGEATRLRAGAAEQLRSLEAELSSITVDEPVLGLAEAVRDLGRGVKAYEEGRSDRGGLEERRRAAEGSALEILRRLAAGAGPVGLEEARSAMAGRNDWRSAHHAWTEAERARLEAAETVRVLETAQAELVATLAGLPDPADPAALQAAVDDALRQGDLDHAVASAQREVEAHRAERTESAGRLGIADEEIAPVLGRPMPGEDERAAVLDQVAAAHRDAAVAEGRAARAEERARELERSLEELALDGELPSEADLGERRGARDASWALVRASWLEGATVTGPGTPFPDDRALADAHADHNAAADVVVDRLWREASRTARRARITADLDAARAEATTARDEGGQRRHEGEEAYRRWRAGWPEQHLPEAPTGLRQWGAEIDRLRAHHRAWTAAWTTRRASSHARRRHRRRLLGLLGGDGVTAVPGTDLGPVLEQARRHLSEVEQLRAERSGTRQTLDATERQIPMARAALAQAAEREPAAADALRRLLGPLGTALRSAATAGDVLDQLHDLDRLLREDEDLRRRIEGIDRRTIAFEAEVDALRSSIPDTVAETPSGAARELAARLETAQAEGARRSTLSEKAVTATDELRSAESELAGRAEELDLLATEAGLGDPDLLEATARRVRRLDELDAELARREAPLTDQGGGRSIAELEAAAAGRDLAQLNAEIEAGVTALKEAEEDRHAAEREVATLAVELAAMDGSDAAAREAARASEELSRAQEGAERYARVVLARFIATEAIRRYNDAHQDPMLRRASAHLGRLTGGSWQQVVVEEQPRGGPRLGAVGPEGDERAVPELSEGTRDQLYLALRLAAIEEAYLRTGPLPVVLDDILVNFDDQRAAAALCCLASLATGGQVLLFTHHRHLVDLAGAVLGATGCTAHDLAERPEPQEPPAADELIGREERSVEPVAGVHGQRLAGDRPGQG